MADATYITRRSLLKTATAVSLAGAFVTAAEAKEAGHPDLLLITMADELDEAQAELDRLAAETRGCTFSSQADFKYQAAFERASNLCNQIEAAQARTLDGLRAKARAIEWCHSGEICLNDQMTSDARLAHQIIHALLQS